MNEGAPALTLHPEDEQDLKRYLLGQASTEQQEAVERRYFDEDSHFELLEAVEAKLIDEYIEGHLAAVDRFAFDSHYLADERRRSRVEGAMALRRAVRLSQGRAGYISAVREFFSARPLTVRLATPILLIVIGASLYQALRRSGTPTFLLVEGVTKDARVPLPTISVSSDAPRVRLQLALTSPTAHESQRAVIRLVGQDRTILWTQPVRPEPRAGTLDISFDASPLKSGDYLLTLEGSSGRTSSYQFRLVQQ